MLNPTSRQKAILDFLVKYIRQHGYPPTFREIGEHFGFLWTAAKGHLKALERKGLIRISPARSRGIEILGLRSPAGIIAPVAGRIRAGSPALAVEDIDAHILIDKTLFRTEDAFSLRVKGDSMTEAGIFDGDYVIVKPQKTISSGETGAVLIGDEATVKRVFIKNKRIILKPENKNMEPVEYKADEIEIIGKVIGVIRKM